MDVNRRHLIGSSAAGAASALVMSPDTAHAVQFASALGLPHPTIGEEVAAAIVCREVPLDVETLQGWMRERVASYKVPTRILIMGESDIPLLASGKPDKIKLASMVAEMAESPIRGR